MTKLEMQFMKNTPITRETIEKNQMLLLSLQNDVRMLVLEFYNEKFQRINQHEFEFQYSLLKAQMDIARLKIKICAPEASVNDIETILS